MNGRKFREYRDAIGLRQAEVADRLNVDRSAVCQWESGVQWPTVKNLIALAKLYHCSTDVLLGLEPLSPSADGS